LDEYCKKKNIQSNNIPCRDEALRDDPIMIHVLKLLGKRANGLCANLSIKRIPKRFAKAWSISEYDGYEDVTIDEDKYRLDEIRNMLYNQEDSKLKEEITAILNEEYHY
jgi:hypothetical protein